MIQRYILDKKIEGTLLDRLNSLSEGEKTVLGSIVEALSPSANTLREILRLADEIAARDGVSAPDVLGGEQIRCELCREGRSRKEKQKAVRVALESLRYPHIQVLRTRLKNDLAEIARSSGVRLELPEDMEGDAVSLQVTIRSTDQMAELGESLKRAARDPAAADIFKVLRGEY